MESAAQNSNAVENPKKNVPLACLFGTLGAAVVYILSTTVIQGIVPNPELAESTGPFGLAYIPHQGDILFASGTKTSVEQQFFDFINGNKYLRDHAGGVAGRNGVDAGWVNQINLSLRQEIPGIFAGRGELDQLRQLGLSLIDVDCLHGLLQLRPVEECSRPA